ncbi:hypothetical protein JCM10207_006127 [Rhodosporidiobolus poonsookiae]
MSSSSDALASAWPAGFTLTGGIPTRGEDLAASIIFIILFALLIPLAVWRFADRRTRTFTLLRPAIIVLVRVATYIIRAIQANGNYDEGLFIGEQVLLLAGLVPLMEPLVKLVRYHVRRTWVPEPPAAEGAAQKKVTTLDRALRLLDLAVLVALILGIVAGSQTGDAIGDPDAASQLKRYRYATIGLSLFVLGVSILVTCAVHLRSSSDMPLPATLYILALSGLLIIPNIYKLVISVHSTALYGSGLKAGFYLLSALPEWLVCLAFFAFNLNDMFSIREGAWKQKVEKKMRKGKWPTGIGYVSREEYVRLKEANASEMSMA